MPKVSEEHMEERKQQIMDAAFNCFARSGFHSTTMQDICREAGLSAGAVYTYFESKEEIIRASCALSQSRSLGILDGLSGEADTRQLIGGMADTFFADCDGSDADQAMRATVNLWSEAVVNPTIGATYRENCSVLREALRGVVQMAQAKADFDQSLDADAIARIMVAIYDGFVLQKALDPSVQTDSFVNVAKALFTGAFWTRAQTN